MNNVLGTFLIMLGGTYTGYVFYVLTKNVSVVFIGGFASVLLAGGAAFLAAGILRK